MQDFVPHSARPPAEPDLPSGTTSLPSAPFIKLERHSPSELWRPPSSPSNHPIPLFTHIPSFHSGRAPTPTTRKKRSAYPYTLPPPRDSSGSRQHSSAMSALHYGNWSSNTAKYEHSEHPSGDLSHMQRKSSDGGQQPPYYFVASVSDSARIRGSAGIDVRRFARIPLCAVTAQISARTLQGPWLLRVSLELWVNQLCRHIPLLRVIIHSTIHHNPPRSSPPP